MAGPGMLPGMTKALLKLLFIAALSVPLFAQSAAQNGRVVWFDLTSTNLEKSKTFYGQLLGWTFAPVEGLGEAVEIRSGGEAVGTLRVADGKISTFNGVVYVQVSDIQAKPEKARELGGTVPEGFPFELPNKKGAVALVIDPGGHPIGLYSPGLLKAPTP